MSTTADPRPVLVGVDGTDESLLACDFGYAEARRRGCGLLLVHAYEAIVTGKATELPFGEPEMRQEGHRLLRDAAKHVQRLGADEVPVEVQLGRGRMPKVVHQQSRVAQLAVIGRHDRPHAVATAGSKAVGLASAVACPLIVVPPRFDPTRRGNVVVGVDTSPRSAAAVQFAFDEASRRGAHVVAVHAWRMPAMAMAAETQDVWRSQVHRHATHVLAEATAEARDAYPDVHADLVPQEGRAAESVLSHLPDAELLVVGTRGMGGMPNVAVGSVARYVIAASDVPVAIVRHLRIRPAAGRTTAPVPGRLQSAAGE